METTTHTFELAGLGKAPFTYVGNERRVFCVPGVEGTSRPGSTCQYCGTPISDCYNLRSADGRTFHVGSSCINKSGDQGLINTAKRDITRAKAATKRARDTKRIEQAQAMLPRVATKLEGQPHPEAPAEWAASKTLLDWVEWMFDHAGTAGKIRASRVIEKS